MNVLSQNIKFGMKFIDNSEKTKNELEELELIIEEKKEEYEKARYNHQLVHAGEHAFNLSQLFYKRASIIKKKSPDQKYGIMCSHKSRAHWLSLAYNLENPSSYTKFASAIMYKDKDPETKHRLEKLSKIGVSNDEKGYIELTSKALDAGERDMCWIMYQSIRHKDSPDSKSRINILKERNIPIDDSGKILLLSVASLGRHIRASTLLDIHFRQNENDVALLPNPLKKEHNLEATQNWFQSISLRDKRIKEEFLENQPESAINQIKWNAFDYNDAEDLKKEIIQNYAL